MKNGAAEMAALASAGGPCSITPYCRTNAAITGGVVNAQYVRLISA